MTGADPFGVSSARWMAWSLVPHAMILISTTTPHSSVQVNAEAACDVSLLYRGGRNFGGHLGVLPPVAGS